MIKRVFKWIAILVLLGICGTGYLIYNTFSQHDKLKAGELSNLIKLDTIQFTYSSSGHIVIHVTIEGSKEEYPFMLDSGAPTIIFSNLRDKFDLKSNGWSIGKNSTGVFSFDKIMHINSLKIGKAYFENLNAVEMPFHNVCSENIYGIIGIGVMRHLVWQIDFKKKIIVIASDMQKLAFSKNKISLSLSENKYSHHLKINLGFSNSFNSKSVLIDLGSNGVVSLKEEYLLEDSLQSNSKLIFGAASKGLGDNTFKNNNEKLVLIDTVFLGSSNHQVMNIPVKTSISGLNMLGLNFFKEYKTTISWDNRLLVLEPYEAQQNFIWRTSGFSTKYDTDLDKVIVKSIIENTPASRSDVTLYSEVISINDFLFSNEESYCAYLKSEDKRDSIKLKFKDSKGSIVEHLLIKEPVL